MLYLLIGPACSGKTTLINDLSQDLLLPRLITCTSRRPRSGEKDGQHYHFFTPEKFEEDVKNGKFIEWARVHGKYYGVHRDKLEELLDSAPAVLGIVDVQGAKTLKAYLGDKCRTIFIAPENLDQIYLRLKLRGSDEKEVEKRMKSARMEMRNLSQWDSLLINKEGEYIHTLSLLKKEIQFE